MDEKRFSLYGPDNWYSLFLKNNYTLIIHTLTYMRKGDISQRQKRQCQDGVIMAWGMTMPNGIIAVKIMEGKQNSEKYISLFKDFAMPL